MMSDAPLPRRQLEANFALVAPSVLRMVLTDPERGVIDIVERHPVPAGAYAGFLGALDAASMTADLTITCDFPHVEGRAVARKSRIKAVIASAIASRFEDVS